jgi:hypothetical protein
MTDAVDPASDGVLERVSGTPERLALVVALQAGWLIIINILCMPHWL